MARVKLNEGKLAKLKSRNPSIEFDKLQLYFREPYLIDLPNAEGSITLTQPSLGDVIKLGEKRFFSTLSVFTSNTTTFRLQLWNQGIDWTEFPDFGLFMMLTKNADREVYQTFLPGINLADFKLIEKEVTPDRIHVREPLSGKQKTTVLYNTQTETEINEAVYLHISQYLRTVFNTFPEEKITHDAIMKEWFIMKDRREENNKKARACEDESILLPLVSACVNHPGFKYKSSELKELGMYQFYDSVKRLQIYEATTALQRGLYSGFMDSSKIKPDDYNFMKPI